MLEEKCTKCAYKANDHLSHHSSACVFTKIMSIVQLIHLN